MAEENFDEHDTSGMPENLLPPEIKGSENDDLGVGEEKRWPGWPGENVFRMLVPVQKVGAIIGRKGECIKKICEETKARIKILDGPPGITERAVMISAKEEPGVPIPPAVDGLLKVHKRVVEVDNDAAAAHAVCTRLLVAAIQGSSLIGKQGATIKSIQEATNCAVRVRGEENLPPIALPDDSIVEIQGEPTNVHKAVELIATHLRKFLVDRSVIGIFEMQMQMPNPRANQDMPPTQSWGPPLPPQDFHMNAGGPGFMPNLQYMPPPPHQFDNYYRPPDMPPFDNQQPPFDNQQPRQGPPVYGRDASMGSHPASMQPQHSIVTKVSQNMQIPLSYADVVIGISGANISYIRRVSGAIIAVQETKGVPGEMTVEINGSASQVQTAQQLIQNSVAEAASAAQNPAGGPPQAAPAPAAAGQGYNSYAADNSYPAANGTAYASQPSNGGGYAPAGDYGPVYGANYGY